MVSSNHIIEVTEADFQYQVLQFSRQKPVVVDFWAEWCAPCKMLGPMLEKLTEESNGKFRLAKVNVDENPNLTLRYGIHSIPSVKGFRKGEVVNEFTGVIPEQEIRAFLQKLMPMPDDLTKAKARSFLESHRWAEAEKNYRKVLSSRNTDGEALLGLAKSLISQNQIQEAYDLLKNFPETGEYHSAELLLPLVEALLENPPPETDELLEATYQRALALVRKGNFPAALDGLIGVLSQNRRYRGDKVRQIILGIFELIGPQSKLARQYQKELASVLF